MPHHTLAWFKSINNVTDDDITPVVDDVIGVQNAHFVPSMDMDLLAFHGGSATATRNRFANAHFRQVVEPQLRPISLSLLPPTDPNVVDYRNNPLRFKANEEIIHQASGAAGGAENYHALAFARWGGIDPMPQGDIYTIRGTHATTVTANVWSTCAVTWDAGLPAGTYACVGGILQSTTGFGFRLIFDNQPARPGGIAFATLGLRSHPMFEKGGLGVWGRFTSIAMPRLQAFCNAADSAGIVFVDFIRVSDRVA